MKKIGVLSDLHLEGSNIDTLHNPGWDILVIPGDLSADLSMLDRFFSYKAPTDIPIIYVLGNHEYEGRRFNTVVDQYREILKPYEHVHLLDNESVIIDNIKFIGSTLWSDFELRGLEQKQQSMDWAKFNVVDFSYIFKPNENGDGYHNISPEEMVQESKKAQKFIEFELKNNSFEGEKFVVTHFAPHPKSVNPNYTKVDVAYWVNNLEHLMGFSQYWVHGHTHTSYDYEVEGTRVICNPRGFAKTFDVNQNYKFNRELILPVNFENDLSVQKTRKNKM